MPLGFFGPSIMKADADLEIAPNVVLAQQNIDPINLSASDKVKEQDTKKAEMLEAQGKAIDAYFTARDMPLKGTGLKMAIEAEKNGIDWRLLPAIAVRESTGGKYACKTVAYSYFGWGGCRINFKSIDHAIEVVALNLGGNNPNTAKHYGGAKTPKQLLQKYNPPSIIPNYAVEVIAIMNAIGKENIGITLKPTTPTNT